MKKLFDKNKLVEFAEKIEIEVNDYNLFQEALIHRSFINESKYDLNHNERLEFLGDAVLELVITEYLFSKFPDRPEGDLTSFRAALVKTESLAEESKRLNVGEYLYMSKGEEQTGGRERPYILANSFESILGFLYLDQGFKTCVQFVKNNLIYKLDEIVEHRLDIDSKSKLQEMAQEVLKVTPVYDLVDEEGPDHDKIFTMSVKIDNKDFGEGKGRSKQMAAQDAATKALDSWDKLLEKYNLNS